MISKNTQITCTTLSYSYITNTCFNLGQINSGFALFSAHAPFLVFLFLYKCVLCAWCVGHHCAVSVPVRLPVHSVMHSIVCACSGRLLISGWRWQVESPGSPGKGDKRGRGSSFTPSLQSCLLYSDACSQSVQEEAAFSGARTAALKATETWPKYLCVRERFLRLINLT